MSLKAIRALLSPWPFGIRRRLRPTTMRASTDINADAQRQASFAGEHSSCRPSADSQLVAADQVPNLDVRPGCQATDIADMSHTTCLRTRGQRATI